MSGGSSSKKKTEDKKAEPTIPGTGAMMTQQPFMGDNQNLLAQQLAAGGYGNVPDLLAMFQQTFTPMQVLDTRPGATPAPGIPSTPSTPSQSTPQLSDWDRKVNKSLLFNRGTQ